MRALIPALLLGLAGCQTLGLAPAQTFDQRLEYAYAGVDTALQTIAQATQDGRLSSTKALQANSMTIAVKQSLDAARAQRPIGSPDAQQALAAVIQHLSEVQAFLLQNGAKP